MAEIVRDYDEWGERLVWWVEWADNDGFPRERYFKTRKQSESFALETEKNLLIESVTSFNEARSQLSSEEKRRFSESIKIPKKKRALQDA